MIGAFQLFRYLLIFVFSIIFGGGSYLGAITLIQKSPSSFNSSLFSKNHSLTGEMQLFAVTEKPVDMCFDEDGVLYFLNQSGEIIKCKRNDESQSQDLSKFYSFSTENFLARKGCSAVAFHPDYLIPYTPGYGKIYISCAEAAGSSESFEALEKEHHQEAIYELTNANPKENAITGKIRQIMRISAEPMQKTVITDLTFDNVGHLYIGISDTVSKSRAADLGSIYGKVLRIDPTENKRKGTTYSIPEKNPFYHVTSSLKELWAYGLRDPHSIYYDPFQKAVCISDTGEEMIEEINFSQSGAEFFGWNMAEGSYFVPVIERQPVEEGVIKPKVEYNRHEGLGRNIGGVIYRGERFPHLDGKALFADESGRLMISNASPSKIASEITILLEGPEGVKVNSLKQGPNGEMFMLCDSGEIYELMKQNPYKKFSRGSMLAFIAH